MVEWIAMDDGSGPAVVACERCGALVHQGQPYCTACGRAQVPANGWRRAKERAGPGRQARQAPEGAAGAPARATEEVSTMPLTIELPRERWAGELAAFSRRNTGRRVRVEVNIPPGEGEPVIAEHQPLMGIDFDPKGSEAPAIEITVGATSGAAPRNLTHVINDPTRIWIEEDPDGLGMAVEIESREEGVTKVLFERALPLPP